MITKERLEELIEQSATIYRTYADVSVQEVKLNKKHMKVDNAFLWQKMTGAFKGCGTPLDKLFETKEEAEWHKEFGCIERTERLELPTWEEVIKLDTSNGIKTIKIFDDIWFYITWDKKVVLTNLLTREFYSHDKLTKENYTLACRQCVKLFKGE